jgi:hypothetical protein
MPTFVRNTLKCLIVVWMVFLLFAYLVLRGDGLVYIGELLNLQVKMIQLPGKILSSVDVVHPVPVGVKKVENEMLKFNYRILQWQFRTYEQLQILVKRANAFFTATYLF